MEKRRSCSIESGSKNLFFSLLSHVIFNTRRGRKLTRKVRDSVHVLQDTCIETWFQEWVYWYTFMYRWRSRHWRTKEEHRNEERTSVEMRASSIHANGRRCLSVHLSVSSANNTSKRFSSLESGLRPSLKHSLSVSCVSMSSHLDSSFLLSWENILCLIKLLCTFCFLDWKARVSSESCIDTTLGIPS